MEFYPILSSLSIPIVIVVQLLFFHIFVVISSRNCYNGVDGNTRKMSCDNDFDWNFGKNSILRLKE